MKVTPGNTEHYFWGDRCDGWYLLKGQQLNVIQERMPPLKREKLHYHEHAQQFFYIISGTATFEVEGEELEVEAGEGLQILPNKIHRIINDSEAEDLIFLVISQPATRGDRIEVVS